MRDASDCSKALARYTPPLSTYIAFPPPKKSATSDRQTVLIWDMTPHTPRLYSHLSSVARHSVPVTDGLDPIRGVNRVFN